MSIIFLIVNPFAKFYVNTGAVTRWKHLKYLDLSWISLGKPTQEGSSLYDLEGPMA